MNFPKLDQLAISIILASLLVFLNLTTVFANTPIQPTPPSPTCDSDALRQPAGIIWESSTNTERKSYCEKVKCLNTRLQALRNQDNDQDSLPQRISDDKCQTLLCPNSQNQYYKNLNEARGDLNSNCQIENGQEECIAQKLPTTQNLCIQCKSALEVANNTPLSQKININLSANDTIKEITERSELNEICGKFRNINSCIIGLSCNSEGDIITNSGQNLNSIPDYSRIPFGTEFFDVTATNDKGLKLDEQGNSNFNINIEGGPIIGIINTVANFLVRMISVFALVIFIIGAFLLITANGDENRLNQGKDAIKYSLLGIVIVMFSYTIVILVQSIFF